MFDGILVASSTLPSQPIGPGLMSLLCAVAPPPRRPTHPQVLLLETGEKAEFFLHQHAELPHHVSVIALLAPHAGAAQDAQYAEATKAFAEVAVEMRIEGYAVRPREY